VSWTRRKGKERKRGNGNCLTIKEESIPIVERYRSTVLIKRDPARIGGGKQVENFVIFLLNSLDKENPCKIQKKKGSSHFLSGDRHQYGKTTKTEIHTSSFHHSDQSAPGESPGRGKKPGKRVGRNEAKKFTILLSESLLRPAMRADV